LPPLRGIRCLVTGASGFLGHHLLAALEREGAEVTAVARVPRSGKKTTWRVADLEDRESIGGLLDAVRPEVVFHLASLVTGRRDLELVLPTFHANLASTVHLLAAATRVGCRRVVLAGSMEEPTAGAPAASPYAASKAASSLYASFFHGAYGAPLVTARIFMAYGPAQRDLAKVIPASILAALDGRAPKISSGSRPVDWIYAEDVARGLITLAGAPGIEGETLDLGSGELATVREVVERICRLAGSPPPEVGALPDRPGETVRRADAAGTRQRVGWSPEVDLDAGLERTLAWYRAARAAGSL
jgi:UDP-glucose 4-epimerase